MLPAIISSTIYSTLFTVVSSIFGDCDVIIKDELAKGGISGNLELPWHCQEDPIKSPNPSPDNFELAVKNIEVVPTNPAPVTWVAEKLSSLWDSVTNHSTLDSDQNPATNSTSENFKLAVKVLDRAAGLNIRDFIRKINVSGFNAEDLEVTIERNHIVVRGTHTYEVERDRETRSMIRRINIPEGIDRNTIQCILDNKQNDQLTILGQKAADGRAQRRKIAVIVKNE